MFQNMDEPQAREQIKDLVKEYYHTFRENKKEFEPGDRINGKSGAINLMPCVDKIAPIGWKPIVGFEEGIRLIVESMDQGHIV